MGDYCSIICGVGCVAGCAPGCAGTGWVTSVVLGGMSSFSAANVGRQV